MDRAPSSLWAPITVGGFLAAAVGLAQIIGLIFFFMRRQRREWKRLDRDRIDRRRRRRGR